MAKIGYARVSTSDQNLDLQIDALRGYGCDEIFRDRGVSGSAETRKGLNEALSKLQRGDTLVVWKIDRLGRSLGFLCNLIKKFQDRGIGFKSIQDPIDTTSDMGIFIFHLFGALAQLENSLIAERTKEGMQAAKRRGRHIGRPRVASEAQLETARGLLANKKSMREAANAVGLNYNTLRRHILT